MEPTRCALQIRTRVLNDNPRRRLPALVSRLHPHRRQDQAQASHGLSRSLDQLDDDQVRCLIAIDNSRVVHAVTSWLPAYRADRAVGPERPHTPGVVRGRWNSPLRRGHPWIPPTRGGGRGLRVMQSATIMLVGVRCDPGSAGAVVPRMR